MIIFFYLRVLINIIYDKIHPVDMDKYNRLIIGRVKENTYLPRTRVIVGFDEENNLYRTLLPPPSTGTLSSSLDRDAHGRKIEDETECISCKFFHKYPNGEISCFMRHDICLVDNKNVYPKQCKDYKKGGFRNDRKRGIRKRKVAK